MTTPRWQTPVGGVTRDTRLVPGCWVESKRFGLCVLTAVHDEWFDVRYKANHLATSAPLWVASTDNKVAFKRPADDESRAVVEAEGAFGIGEGRSDPRM